MSWRVECGKSYEICIFGFVLMSGMNFICLECENGMKCVAVESQPCDDWCFWCEKWKSLFFMCGLGWKVKDYVLSLGFGWEKRGSDGFCCDLFWFVMKREKEMAVLWFLMEREVKMSILWIILVVWCVLMKRKTKRWVLSFWIVVEMVREMGKRYFGWFWCVLVLNRRLRVICREKLLFLMSLVDVSDRHRWFAWGKWSFLMFWLVPFWHRECIVSLRLMRKMSILLIWRFFLSPTTALSRL